MTTHRMRIWALAAVAAVAVTGPAWAAEPAPQETMPQSNAPEGKPPAVTYMLDKGVTSNRLATARMWTELSDATQLLRTAVVAEDWDQALKRVREVRTRIDQISASKVVDRNARLIIGELRPFAVSLEQRITHGRGRSVLRGVDTLLAQVARTQNELLASGAMERMGGGAGAWRMPKMPEVKIYPPGTGPEAVPPAPAPKEEDRDSPNEDPNRNLSPGNERNQMEEWREPID